MSKIYYNCTFFYHLDFFAALPFHFIFAMNGPQTENLRCALQVLFLEVSIVSQIIPWLVVLVYIVPIIGTLISMKRRAASVWSFGDSIRRLFPDDLVYRKIKKFGVSYQAWKNRHPIARFVNLDHLNWSAGVVEYAFGHLRDYTLGAYMMAAFAWDITQMIFGDAVIRGEEFPSLFYHGFFALLSLWTYRRHVSTGLKMTEFMRMNKHVHPSDFFDHYYRALGPLATPIPARATRLVDPTNVSYLTGKKPRQLYWPLLHGFYDTAIFARSAYKAIEVISGDYGREVFDVMASLWGSRMLQLFRGRLTVQGLEKFNDLEGKIILVFNHKSHLDFVFNFFALSPTHLKNGRAPRPRYLTAKDHFVDNKIVYSGLGVGKLIENVDMVFVDRKGQGKNAILDACQRLVHKDIDIAIFPQGTRALPNYGPQGERLDAGFYTTGTARSLKEDLGHLKKGCAFLALDTATAVKPLGNIPVHLVFIGIDGTSTLVPKGSFKVQTETTVKFTVGDIYTLQDGDTVESLQVKIDQGLSKALVIRTKLRERFVDDLKTSSRADVILKVNHSLIQAEQNEKPLPFVILDLMYALPYKEQDSHLTSIADKIASGGDLQPLREQLAEQLFQHRGKELKTIAQQEKSKKVS